MYVLIKNSIYILLPYQVWWMDSVKLMQWIGGWDCVVCYEMQIQSDNSDWGLVIIRNVIFPCKVTKPMTDYVALNNFTMYVI